jgi:hypothetical protein
VVIGLFADIGRIGLVIVVELFDTAIEARQQTALDQEIIKSVRLALYTERINQQ